MNIKSTSRDISDIVGCKPQKIEPFYFPLRVCDELLLSFLAVANMTIQDSNIQN